MNKSFFILADNSKLSQKTINFWINEAKKAKLPQKDIEKTQKIAKRMRKSEINTYYFDLDTFIENEVTKKIAYINKNFILLPKNS